MFESLEGSWGLSIQVFLVILLTLLPDFAFKKILNQLCEKPKLTENPLDDTLVDALRPPASMLIWVVGVYLAVEVIRHDTHRGDF